MKKKTMVIGGSVLAGVLLLFGGAGIALAISDGFDNDDDDRTSQVSDQQGSNQQGGSNQGNGNNNGDDDDRYDDDNNNSTDPDDAPISDTERSSAEDAAIEAAGGGTVTDLDRSDDNDHAWEVEVTLADGSEVDVELDADFGVVRVDPEN